MSHWMIKLSLKENFTAIIVWIIYNFKNSTCKEFYCDNEKNADENFP